MKSIDDSHQILLSKIEKTAEDKTYADLRFKPQAKDIEVVYAKRTPDPTNIKSDYKIEYDRIIIPASCWVYPLKNNKSISWMHFGFNFLINSLIPIASILLMVLELS